LRSLSSICQRPNSSRAKVATTTAVANEPLRKHSQSPHHICWQRSVRPRAGQPTPALFNEFRETGMAEKLGYENPADLRRNYPHFFWKVVHPIADALRCRRVTQEGQQWIANLYANVFSTEHSGHLNKIST
jgi:hypothetical protein